MARIERDREDLLREATALVERAELRIPAFGETVFAGFRRSGSASFFFGQELVFQFNSRLQLRRGFDHGQSIVADHGCLYVVERASSSSRMQLRRRQLNERAAKSFLSLCDKHLTLLQSALTDNTQVLVGQVPAAGSVVERICAWLIEFPHPIQIADQPHAR